MADDDTAEKVEQTETESKPKPPRKKSGTAHEEVQAPSAPRAGSLIQKLKDYGTWCLRRKKLSLPIGLGLLLILLLAVPFTRYSLLGLFLKQDFSVVVLDSQNGRPVSSARVSLDGHNALTDGKGTTHFRLAVGEAKLTISKSYYKAFSREVVVPIQKPESDLVVRLEATGRPVPVKVVNSISGKPIAGATLSAGASQAKTDDRGQTVLVVPIGSSGIAVTVKAEGYNQAATTVELKADLDQETTLTLTPTGKIYFLSNQSGKLDVVKSDLDGQNRQTVLAGTGKEAKGETVLLASRDWKFLALQSKRDGGDDPKLFLISTADDSLTTMDEGTAGYTLVGWEGHRFVYKVNRYKTPSWQPKAQALKNYNADTKKLTTLDQTAAEGDNDYNYKRENFSAIYLVNGKLVYGKWWTGGGAYTYYEIALLHAALYSIQPDGSDKKTVKTFDSNDLEIRTYEEGSLYVKSKELIFEYEDGALKSLPNVKPDVFYNTEYLTFLLSPDGKRIFWAQDRDGKFAFFVADTDGKNSNRVATLDTAFQTYGWYTDDYLLVSKNSSELYIMPVSGVEKAEQLIKITDYYKPFYSYYGYGGGYGGL
jgi:hypothetical protein